jgi:hypothetical protein
MVILARSSKVNLGTHSRKNRPLGAVRLKVGSQCAGILTNRRGSDVDGPSPTRGPKSDRRTHMLAAPHRPDILRSPLAAAL